MLSKKEFVSLMNILVRRFQEHEDFVDDLDKVIKKHNREVFIDGTSLTELTGDTNMITDMLKWLSDAMGDEDGKYGTLIDWWFWECDQGKNKEMATWSTTSGIQHMVYTPEELYDLLLFNHKPPLV